MRVQAVCNGLNMGRGGASERSVGTTNSQRREWARVALSAYAPLVYGQPFAELVAKDRETCLTDLLADLIHLCRSEEIDFDDCLRQARTHAGAEARFGWDEPTE